MARRGPEVRRAGSSPRPIAIIPTADQRPVPLRSRLACVSCTTSSAIPAAAFSAQVSHVVVERHSRELVALVLGSRVSPQSGHITQVCVHPRLPPARHGAHAALSGRVPLHAPWVHRDFAHRHRIEHHGHRSVQGRGLRLRAHIRCRSLGAEFDLCLQATTGIIPRHKSPVLAPFFWRKGGKQFVSASLPRASAAPQVLSGR
jgi:hypothetical protein